ncbi:MAG: hypothetical protein BTN85_2014 [Candidatus Methanohalarchaeum thermophilum]|uniref:Uncharacterized protein n=1 Tax=Methanohalarchaeum thermophilum TaxID=1903181 RepID=A0A1Q6DSL3_METT1|nr:MAG: hypothetical protein BTN85_2014 [Candidatus Methanohalarchaeum thermophilum]
MSLFGAMIIFPKFYLYLNLSDNFLLFLVFSLIASNIFYSLFYYRKKELVYSSSFHISLAAIILIFSFLLGFYTIFYFLSFAGIVVFLALASSVSPKKTSRKTQIIAHYSLVWFILGFQNIFVSLFLVFINQPDEIIARNPWTNLFFNFERIYGYLTTENYFWKNIYKLISLTIFLSVIANNRKLRSFKISDKIDSLTKFLSLRPIISKISKIQDKVDKKRKKRKKRYIKEYKDISKEYKGKLNEFNTNLRKIKNLSEKKDSFKQLKRRKSSFKDLEFYKTVSTNIEDKNKPNELKPRELKKRTKKIKNKKKELEKQIEKSKKILKKEETKNDIIKEIDNLNQID